MKHLIRRFSLWLESRTRKWVVPSSVWKKLDAGDVTAQLDLCEVAVKWGTLDPEFVRANLLLSRIRHKGKV